jgi:hypothetical protein
VLWDAMAHEGVIIFIFLGVVPVYDCVFAIKRVVGSIVFWNTPPIFYTFIA